LPRGITYHPKFFLAHDAKWSRQLGSYLAVPILSASAFSDSVEVGVLGEEARPVRTLGRWFDNLFNRHSVDFTADLLAEMTRSGVSKPLNAAQKFVFEGSEIEQSSRRSSRLSRKTSTLLMMFSRRYKSQSAC